MQFVTEGLKFDQDVLKTTCAHALPYDPTEVKQIFKNKTDLGDNLRISQKLEQPKRLRKWPNGNQKVGLDLMPYQELINQPAKDVKFKPKDPFITVDSSDDEYNQQKPLAIDNVPFSEKEKITTVTKPVDHKQAEVEQVKSDAVFLTETSEMDSTIRAGDQKKLSLSKSLTNLDFNSKEQARRKNDWDDYVLSKLSENTARWIVGKKTDSKFNLPFNY